MKRRVESTEEILPVYNLGTFVDGAVEQLAEIEAKIREEDNLTEFFNLWETNASYLRWYSLARKIRPDLTMARWREAWQWRTILHESFDQAIVEFANALWGWY